MRDPHSIAKAPQLPSSGWGQWDNKPLPHQTENENKTWNITTDSWTLLGQTVHFLVATSQTLDVTRTRWKNPNLRNHVLLLYKGRTWQCIIHLYFPSLHQPMSFTVDLRLCNTNYINNHFAKLLLKFLRVMIQEGETSGNFSHFLKYTY